MDTERMARLARLIVDLWEIADHAQAVWAAVCAWN